MLVARGSGQIIGTYGNQQAISNESNLPVHWYSRKRKASVIISLVLPTD